MAIALTISTAPSGSRITYNPINANGEYFVVLDEAKMYEFFISKTRDTNIVAEIESTDVNGKPEFVTLADNYEKIFIQYRSKITFKINNIISDVGIQSKIYG